MSNTAKSLQLLLIEDDRIEAALIRDQIETSEFAGAALHHCTRVVEGLKALAEGNYDVVLLDLNLPDGNGIENLRRVTAVNDIIPVIILTNVEDNNMAMDAVGDGAQDYLIKRSITSDVLGRAIRYAIARKGTEVSLRESEQRFSLAVAGARDGIWDWDLTTDHVYYSPRWCYMLGLDENARQMPSTWLDRVHDADRSGLRKALTAHIEGQTSHFEHEFRLEVANKTMRWALARGVAVRDENGEAVRIAGSLTDISERKETEAMLVHEALHDALTGLPNRNLFLDRLDLALKQHRRDANRKFAVLFLDLDRFKAINDSLGHAAGDALLMEFGKRLSMFLRPGDSIARLGGDEFAILLMEISGLGEATLVAERVHELLSQKFVLIDKEVFVNASIGIALSDTKYERSADLLRDADLAMYRTKRRQSGSYSVFDHVMHESALKRLELETDLRTARIRGELATYYQPIVSLEKMRITGFEALMRWFHPARGLIGPEEFIPLAEETGIISELTWWIMEQACSQTQKWQQSDPNQEELSISVNVSTRLFSEPDFAQKTLGILEKTGLAPRSLHIEITENALLDHQEETVRELSELQSRGVKLHLDDFGTGYSSLSYLSEFDYDTIKIDRSFVTASSDLKRDHRIVDALVGLGHVLNIGVIAEGVETQEQAQKLRELDCSMAQGFWFSKPLPSDSAEALLTQENKLARSTVRNVVRH